MKKHRAQLILTVVLLLVALPAQARDADQWAADYEQLNRWEFFTESVPLPPEGVRLERDTAEWIFESGTVRLMRPTTDGSVTGLVFEGQGRFQMTVPDPVEVGQLSRFPGSKTTDPPRFTFRRMVLRTTEARVMDLFPPAAGGDYKKSPLANQRHLWWQERARFDADARVVAGLLNPNDEYLAIDMETDEEGWLFYEFDGWRMEEIRLCRMRKSKDFVEVWVSLDRAEHRRPDGRPGSARTPLVDLIHADLKVDLMKHKGRAGQEISRKRWDREYPWTSFTAEMEFESMVDGLQAIPLRLKPWSVDVTVTDGQGGALPVLRAPLGKRFPLIQPKEEDTSLVVVLDQPLARSERIVLSFTWQRQTSNSPGGDDPHPLRTRFSAAGGGQDWYPPFTHQQGRYWYPEPLEGRDDRHTARVTLVHPKKLLVRASGTPAGSREEGKQQIDVWESDSPIKAAGWTYGYGFKERRILREGLPEVVGFGANRIQQVGDAVEAAAAHMADSIRFYQDVFEYPLPLKTVTGTRVNGGSQSFSGFIAYDDSTFDLSSSWESEWSMAKRTAELFWGQSLDWESYRDSWLADALAGYSAMMYLEAVTQYWDIRQRGSIKNYDELVRLRQRRLAYANSYLNRRLGPLDVGFRDIVPELTTSYNHSKGMAVLHMLRGILKGRSEDGDRQFKAILADFLKSNLGKTASTAEFIATVERQTSEDWGWFFDQWVYGTEIPTYTWSHGVTPEPAADGLYELTIDMEQRGVSPGFRMPVTFGLEYGDAGPELLHLQMDQPSKTFTARLPFKPKKVTFDPNHELLFVVE
jgi:hypothetical protein